MSSAPTAAGGHYSTAFGPSDSYFLPRSNTLPFSPPELLPLYLRSYEGRTLTRPIAYGRKKLRENLPQRRTHAYTSGVYPIEEIRPVGIVAKGRSHRLVHGREPWHEETNSIRLRSYDARIRTKARVHPSWNGCLSSLERRGYVPTKRTHPVNVKEGYRR